MKETKKEMDGEVKATWHEKHKQSMTFGDRIAVRYPIFKTKSKPINSILT